MAGPIATAFVNVIARLRLDQNNDLERDLRGQIGSIERELKQLEGAARSAGAGVARALKGVRVDLETRSAIVDLQRMEGAVNEVSTELNDLQGRSVKLQTGQAATSIRRVEELATSLSRTLQLVDGEEIDFNVSDAVRDLKALERATTRMIDELAKVKNTRIRADAESAIEDMEALQRAANETLTRLERIDATRVRVRVEDLELERLEARVRALDQEKIDIVARVDATGLNRLNQGVDKLNVNLNNFGDQFRNIAFRAVSYLAVGQALQAFQRMVTFGIEAAGKIQTVTVGLNRLFADMQQLGSTASEFIGDLRNLALTTPFEFIDLADTSRRLVQLGGDAELALQRMQQLADAGAAVGATSDDINGVVRALSQMAAKGRINLQDLNQVAERLPNFQRQLQLQGVIKELEDMGSPLAKTVNSFDDLRKAGVPIQTVIDGIFRGLEEIPGAAGAAAAQARTLQGALSNLRDFAQLEFAEAFKEVGGTLADELNLAFGVADDGFASLEEDTSDLGDAFTDVISAFGVGLNNVLPDVLDFFEDISDELASLADTTAAAVRSFSTGFGGELFAGLLQGLNNVINAATVLNDILGNVLPAGATEGIGKVAGELIALTRIFGPGVIAPFQKALRDLIFEFGRLRDGAVTVRGALSSITPSFKQAGAAAVGLALVTIAFDKMATSARRTREFEQSINRATSALEEFSTVGEAAVSFLEDFEQAGEGVNLGEWENLINGLTSGELEQAFGANRQQLALLVTELAKVPELLAVLEAGAGSNVIPTALRAGRSEILGLEEALAEAGFELENFEAAGADAQGSLLALVSQFGQSAEVALRSAVNTRRFAFVSEDAAAAILEAAEATGAFGSKMEEITELNTTNARREFDRLAGQLNLTGSEIRSVEQAAKDAETGTVDWVAATGQLREMLLDVDEAMLGLQERASNVPLLAAAFDIAATKGAGLTTQLSDFAVAAAAADLSAEELDAVARQLGTTLTGEELGQALDEVAGKFEEFKGSLEGLIPGIANLQIETDSFSLDKFVEELAKINTAQVEVEENIRELIDEFGDLGVDALEALVGSGLSPEHFAQAVAQAVDATPGELERLILLFTAAGETSAGEFARTLAANGVDQETVDKIAGLPFFDAAGAKAADALGLSFERQLGDLIHPGLLTTEGAPASAFTLPDVGPVKEQARSAAAEVGQTFGTTLDSSLSESVGAAVQDVGTQVVSALEGVGVSAFNAASSAGSETGLAFTAGFTQGLEGLTAAAASGFSSGFGAVGPSLELLIAGMVSAVRTALTNEAFEAGAFLAIDFQLGVAEGLSSLGSFAVAPALSTAAEDALQNAFEGGERAGGEFVAGFGGALPELAAAVVKVLAKAAGAARAAALPLGFSVGSSFGAGLSAGVLARVGSAAAAASSLVAATYAAARRAAEANSPSKLFERLGRDIGEGAAAGVLASVPAMSRAGEALVAAAAGGRISAAGGVSLPSSLPPANLAAAAALRGSPLSGASPGRLAALPAAAPASQTLVQLGPIVAPTDDPETLAARVAARLEARLT